MGKRKDECLFCRNRFCYSRIVSSEDDGKIYDEVACHKHTVELEKHSDEKAPKVMKYFVSSTYKQSRGKPFLYHEREVK